MSWLCLHDSATNPCPEPSESSRNPFYRISLKYIFALITIYASTTQVVSFPQASLPKLPMDISRLPHASHCQPFRCHLASNAVTEPLGMQYATVPSYLTYQV